jgi:hypothetical protein
MVMTLRSNGPGKATLAKRLALSSWEEAKRGRFAYIAYPPAHFQHNLPAARHHNYIRAAALESSSMRGQSQNNWYFRSIYVHI